MRGTSKRYLTFIFVAVALIITASCSVVAQEKDAEAKKPSPSNIDAWRQSLPPEAEIERSAEGATNSAPQRPSREEVEASVVALERKWMESLKSRDASALSQLIGDDFSLISPQLVLAAGDRDKYFKHALHDLTLASYELDTLTVRLYGRAAVVNARLKQSARIAGEDWSGTYLVTDVWASRDGAWRVVSRHASLLPEKGRDTPK